MLKRERGGGRKKRADASTTGNRSTDTSPPIQYHGVRDGPCETWWSSGSSGVWIPEERLWRNRED